MLQKTIVILLSLLLIAIIALVASGNGFLLTAIQRTYLQGNITANIKDYEYFDVRTIKTNNPNEIPKNSGYQNISLPESFEKKLVSHDTTAFLIVKDQQIVYEQYFGDYHARSKTNVFSVAKTVVTLLLGIAIEEGIINSLDQKLIDFLPEFSNDPNGKKATIGHLSLMTSGYEWTEHYYSPFSPTVELLYSHDVEDFLLDGYFSATPGEFWKYSSASTQLLAIALTRALQQSNAATNLSEYLSQKLWQPLQMNDDALWHLDGVGMELAYCCINTNARNLAKLGLLLSNKGYWQGKQLISSDFIDLMTTPQGQPDFGYSIRTRPNETPRYFWFSGHLGQYIIVIPEHDIVIVRLGETTDSNIDFRNVEIPNYIEHALEHLSTK